MILPLSLPRLWQELPSRPLDLQELTTPLHLQSERSSLKQRSDHASSLLLKPSVAPLCSRGKPKLHQGHPRTGPNEGEGSINTSKTGSYHVCAYVCAKSPQSCPTFCDPMDCSPPGSSVHGILQARILKWVAMSSSRGSSRTRDRPMSLMSPALANGFFTTSTTWEAPGVVAVATKSGFGKTISFGYCLSWEFLTGDQ